MSEMTTLLAAIYRQYTTAAADGFDNSASPAITARYELFYDDSRHWKDIRVCFRDLTLMTV